MGGSVVASIVIGIVLCVLGAVWIGQGVGRRHISDVDRPTRLNGKSLVTERQMMAEKKARRGTSQSDAVQKLYLGHADGDGVAEGGATSVGRRPEASHRTLSRWTA